MPRQRLDENGNRKLMQNKVFQKYGNSIIVRIPQTKMNLIIGKHWPGVLFTLCVIVGGSVMNLRILTKTNSLSLPAKDMYRVFVVIMAALTTVFLFLTATTDPGIVFVNPFTVSDGDEECVDSERHHLNLQDMPFCDVCSIYQMPRMHIHHCDECNCCIEGMDHHCPWMVRVFHCSCNKYSVLKVLHRRVSALGKRI
jgi:palmitoyltransferase